MKASELMRNLICMAFDPESAEKPISLDVALRIYAEILHGEREQAEQTPKESEKPFIENFAGYGAREKRDTLKRLEAYIKETGAGAFRRIAEASHGDLTESDVSLINQRLKVNINKWRALAAALTELEVANEPDEP